MARTTFWSWIISQNSLRCVILMTRPPLSSSLNWNQSLPVMGYRKSWLLITCHSPAVQWRSLWMSGTSLSLRQVSTIHSQMDSLSVSFRQLRSSWEKRKRAAKSQTLPSCSIGTRRLQTAASAQLNCWWAGCFEPRCSSPQTSWGQLLKLAGHSYKKGRTGRSTTTTDPPRTCHPWDQVMWCECVTTTPGIRLNARIWSWLKMTRCFEEIVVTSSTPLRTRPSSHCPSRRTLWHHLPTLWRHRTNQTWHHRAVPSRVPQPQLAKQHLSCPWSYLTASSSNKWPAAVEARTRGLPHTERKTHQTPCTFPGGIPCQFQEEY